jgi:hypothetical protein
MKAHYLYHVGDTEPTPDVTFEDAAGNPIDLTGADVRWQMRRMGAFSLVLDDGAEIVTAAEGTALYRPTAAMTAQRGVYQARWRAIYPDGSIVTAPGDGWLTVIVHG